MKDQPLAVRIMKILRDRKSSGLPPAVTLDQLQYAFRTVDRRAIREALEVLIKSGKVSLDRGPQDLGSQRVPDRYSAI
jgi:hypothetical protein